MNIHFSNRDKMIVVMVIFFLLLGTVIVQFLFLNPLNSDLMMKKQTLNSEENLLNKIGKNKKKNPENTNKSVSRNLQLSLPVKPLQDQFILNLEKAEILSNSQIKSMNFSIEGQGQNQAVQEAGNAVVNGQTNPITTNQQNNSTTSPAANQSQETSLPASIKKITVQLSVVSPGYAEFEKFINTLEEQKRLVVVDAIQYTASSEQTSLDQTPGPLTFNLTVSTFYIPGLTDLDGQLPKVEEGKPSGKENPLSQFLDVNSSK